MQGKQWGYFNLHSAWCFKSINYTCLENMPLTCRTTNAPVLANPGAIPPDIKLGRLYMKDLQCINGFLSQLGRMGYFYPPFPSIFLSLASLMLAPLTERLEQANISLPCCYNYRQNYEKYTFQASRHHNGRQINAKISFNNSSPSV